MSFFHFGSSSSLKKPSRPIGAPSPGTPDLQLGHASFHPYSTNTNVDSFFQQIPKKIRKFLPKPNKYDILQTIQVGSHLVLVIKYDACTYYEGKKILVFEDITLEKLLERNNNLIDPHFCDNTNFVSPVARFEPTENGLDMAIQFAKKIL